MDRVWVPNRVNALTEDEKAAIREKFQIKLPKSDERYYTVDQMASILGKGSSTVQLWCKNKTPVNEKGTFLVRERVSFSSEDGTTSTQWGYAFQDEE